MYTAFFGLRCLPFEDRADAQFFFPAAEHEETLAAMEYEAHYGTGIGLVLGEAGTGKTLLIRALLSRLHATDHVAVITTPDNGEGEILRECCKGFGVSLPSSPNDSRRLNRLRRHLVRTIDAGHRAILVVDQAEHLTPANMGEIETLAEQQAEQGRLLHVMLAGHPRLRLLLNQPDFVRVRQQAFKERVLSPLTESETKDYIRHRLQVAGAGEADLFDPGALALVHASSGGVPRLINQMCNASMLAAYGAGESRISASIVVEVTGMASLPASKRVRQEPHRPIMAAHDATDRPENSAAAGIFREAAAESRLRSLIERAERVGEVLARSIPQAADTAAQVQRRVERIIGDADERMRAMESRLTEVCKIHEKTLKIVSAVERTIGGANEAIERLNGLQIDTNVLAARLDSDRAAARQMGDALTGLVAAADQKIGQLSSSHAAASQVQGRLAKTVVSGHQLVERADESVRRVEEWMTLLKKTMETGESLLNEYLSRIGAVDVRLSHFSDRSATLERKIAEGMVSAKAVVANAQAQAEHLDRVCTAVRKVFAGLSQASLQANEQTEGLHRAGAEAKRQLLHLTTESERAAKTLHEWLEEALRVQARLEQVLQQSPSVSQTHPIEPLRSAVRRLGSVERSATINIEDEPGAAKARELDVGLDRMAIREPAARADEIARLIAEARAAKAEAAAPV